jgi:hypothetical protein
VGEAPHSDVTWGAPTLTLPREGGRGDTAVRTKHEGMAYALDYGIANRSVLPPPVMSMVA